jgi:hypothetical protein
MANRIVAVQYTSGAGNAFVTGMNEEVWDQETATPGEHLVGGSVALPTEALDPLPRQLKPRRAVLRNAAGVTREIICLTSNAPLLTIGTTIDLEDSDGASTEFTTVATKAESYRRRTQQPV